MSEGMSLPAVHVHSRRASSSSISVQSNSLSVEYLSAALVASSGILHCDCEGLQCRHTACGFKRLNELPQSCKLCLVCLWKSVRGMGKVWKCVSHAPVVSVLEMKWPLSLALIPAHGISAKRSGFDFGELKMLLFAAPLHCRLPYSISNHNKLNKIHQTERSDGRKELGLSKWYWGQSSTSNGRELFEDLSLKCRQSCLVDALCKEQRWSWGDFTLQLNSLVLIWASKALMAGVECAVGSYWELIMNSNVWNQESQCRQLSCQLKGIGKLSALRSE